MKYIIEINDNSVEYVQLLTLYGETKEMFRISALELYEESEDEYSTGWELYNAYQKAKEKYETWKKQKDKIKIGYEVHVYNASSEEYGVVTSITETEAQVLMRNGCFYNVPLTNCIKTGKYFPEIAEAINKIKEVYKNETT